MFKSAMRLFACSGLGQYWGGGEVLYYRLDHQSHSTASKQFNKNVAQHKSKDKGSSSYRYPGLLLESNCSLKWNENGGVGFRV